MTFETYHRTTLIFWLDGRQIQKVRFSPGGILLPRQILLPKSNKWKDWRRSLSDLKYCTFDNRLSYSHKSFYVASLIRQTASYSVISNKQDRHQPIIRSPSVFGPLKESTIKRRNFRDPSVTNECRQVKVQVLQMWHTLQFSSTRLYDSVTILFRRIPVQWIFMTAPHHSRVHILLWLFERMADVKDDDDDDTVNDFQVMKQQQGQPL